MVSPCFSFLFIIVTSILAFYFVFLCKLCQSKHFSGDLFLSWLLRSYFLWHISSQPCALMIEECHYSCYLHVCIPHTKKFFKIIRELVFNCPNQSNCLPGSLLIPFNNAAVFFLLLPIEKHWRQTQVFTLMGTCNKEDSWRRVRSDHFRKKDDESCIVCNFK